MAYKKIKSLMAGMLVSTILISCLPSNVVFAKVISNKNTNEYEIYPNPQAIEYLNGEFNISSDVNVVYESGIDQYTKDLLNNILKDKSKTITESKEIVEGKTNILVGIYNDEDQTVDNYFNQEKKIEDTSLFEKKDSHILDIDDNVIAVLGSDTDSAFYGLTTFKHITNQIEDTIRNLNIKDYSDVAFRGFIEGYYGNPWSNEDRAELMKYGGDFKMNAYIFAPKDDPYHNSRWRELYPQEKLEEIKQLALAGEKSKTRYVYALHPYMSNPIRHGNEQQYQEDLKTIKSKLTQLMDAGVRQFAILADDAAVPAGGAGSYVKLMEDLTNWLTQLQEEGTYQGLKKELLFCPNDYMGNGSSEQLKVVNKMPRSVSIIMTGGRVWGEVTNNFVTNFYNNIASEENEGRGPFMWINWPCSDNSKNHLIMGGNSTFLHPGVDPTKIQGIVLNPMQQSEASKSAIFANADYAWNIWDNEEQAKQNWNDSFKYMDHGTSEDTEASNALREMCKHMINQDMDTRVTKLEESVDLAPKLNAFKEAFTNGQDVTAQADELINEFTTIYNATETYRNNAKNQRVKEQIIHWVNSLRDISQSNIELLKAVKALKAENNSDIWTYYSQGQAKYEASKTYGFKYLSETKYAEAGVQHIVPFTKYLLDNLSQEIAAIVDPSKVVTKVITNREDAPTGSLSNLIDGNEGTQVVFKNPNSISTNTYIGVSYNKAIKVNNIKFEMGTKENPGDTFTSAKLQYTENGADWIDIPGAVFNNTPGTLAIDNIDITAKGIRAISTSDKSNTWLGCKEIYVNENAQTSDEGEILDATIERTPLWKVHQGPESNLTDGNDSTFVWYDPDGSGNSNSDDSLVDDYIGLDLKEVTNVGKVHIVVGNSGGDKWRKYDLVYSTDGDKWTTYKSYNGAASGVDVIDEDFEGIEARYVRLVNKERVGAWVKFSEFNVKKNVNGITKYTYTNVDELKEIKNKYSIDLASLEAKDNITLSSDQYVGLKLDRIKDLSEINVETSNNKEGLTLEISANGVEWNTVNSNDDIKFARYIRLINKTDSDVTFDLNKFEVGSNEIKEPQFVETTMGINSAYGSEDSRKTGTLGNIFDGNMNTKTNFSDYQKAGRYITYDLGQVRDINQLRLYVTEGEINYIRDAKVQVSMDGTEWTDMFEIGDGQKNVKFDDTTKYDDGYSNPSGGMCYAGDAEKRENAVQAKYIRILFTADYDHRFVAINEIEINGGEYIKECNDPTFVVDPIEKRNQTPYNLLDGNLTSSFIPNMEGRESGSLTYRLSEDTNVTQINILQNSNEISNAKVSARVDSDENGEKWIELGTLDKSLNTFYNSLYDNVFEIKIEWGNVTPTIYELITITDEYVNAPNKSELQEYVSSLNDIVEEDYTADSYNQFKDAKEKAEATLASNTATQKEIDDALNELKAAKEALVKSINKKALQLTVDYAGRVVNEGALENVIPVVVEEFNSAYEAAKEVLENKDSTQVEVNEAVRKLTSAIEKLEFKKGNKETLKALIDSVEALNKDGYTTESWNALQAQLELANGVFNDENAMQEEVDKATKDLQGAIDSLVVYNVNIKELQSLVEEVSKLEEEKYIASTWTKFTAALNKANEILDKVQPTQEEVDAAYNELFNARLDLRLIPDKSILEGLVTEATNIDASLYSKESIEKLNEQLAKAKEILSDEEATQESVDSVEESLRAAIDGLEKVDEDKNDGTVDKDDTDNETDDKNDTDNETEDKNNTGNGQNINKPNGDKGNESDSTKTGDTSALGMLGMALLGSGFVLFKRKKNK